MIEPCIHYRTAWLWFRQGKLPPSGHTDAYGDYSRPGACVLVGWGGGVCPGVVARAEGRFGETGGQACGVGGRAEDEGREGGKRGGVGT